MKLQAKQRLRDGESIEAASNLQHLNAAIKHLQAAAKELTHPDLTEKVGHSAGAMHVLEVMQGLTKIAVPELASVMQTALSKGQTSGQVSAEIARTLSRYSR